MVVSETFKNDYLPTLVGHDKLKTIPTILISAIYV